MDNPPRYVIRLTLSPARVLLGSAIGGLIGARFGGAGGAFLGGFLGTMLVGLLPGPATAAPPADPDDGEGDFDANGQPHGPWLWRYANGQPKHEVHYEHGVAEGLETYWYLSGRKEIQCRRVAGRREGEGSFYHPNGELASRGRFLGDRLDGDWSYYNEAGELLRTCHYVDGQLDGAVVTYGSDGEPISEERYGLGLPHGLRVEHVGGTGKPLETLMVAGLPVPRRGRARLAFQAGSRVSPNGWVAWTAVLLLLLSSFAKDPSVGVGLLLIIMAIGLHELGHLAAAWLVGIPIEVFRVGIGPTIGRVRWGVTTFELGLIPVLGYVKPFEIRPSDWPLYRSVRSMLRDSPPDVIPPLPPPAAPATEELRPVSDLVTRPRRLVFLLGGIAVNLALGIGLYAAVRSPAAVRRDFPVISAEIINGAPESVAESFRPSTYQSSEPGAVATLGGIARLSWSNFFVVFGVVNLCLGVFNSLPIPPLDGFRALVVSIEMVTRRELPKRAAFLLMVLGLLMLSLILFTNLAALLRDIANVFRR